MQQSGRTYIAIDLKSFYASVECMERGLDPLTTNLVVADASRTEKTICLAVSPSLKAYGISGRARLFEVVERVKEVNAERRRKAGCLSEKSFNANELAADPSREVDYLIAPPRMAKYIQVSTQVYNVYLKYIAPEDIHVYSIDEVMMDVTNYLQTYRMTARELAKVMISDVLHTTGITATAGIGSNLYLCKVSMDIMAKHVQPDKDGVRIAALDEMSYREQLWEHRPLTDFWRVGRGYTKKLEAMWFGDSRDDETLDWLESLPFTVAFVDGNHENFDALAACLTEEWHSGKIQCIRPHVLHLMRGQVYELEGYRFFTMGGAKSHDIEDGILEPDAPDFERRLTMLQRKPRARYRINHISWWAQELPSDEEYAEARRNLDAVGWQVDYIITHCAPTSIALMGSRHNEADRLTDFLQEVRERAKYHYWLFGHYHDNKAIDEKHILLWEQIVQIC